MTKKIQVKFTKMSGAGNDFVLIDNRSEEYNIDWSKLAPNICNRRYGVGADGVLIVENSLISNFKMKYYNADGSYGGMCGNGGRCASLYVIKDLNSDKVRFEAFGHAYEAERIDEINVKLKMNEPKDIQLNIKLGVYNAIIPAHFVNSGAPHVVIFYSDLSASLTSQINSNGILLIGATIRHLEYFKPKGTNVDFVEVLGSSRISMRTYERGVEDETFACGTGAIACSVISSITKNMNSPIEIRTKSNEILIVEFQRSGNIFNEVSLIGSARIVFAGHYCYTL